MLPQAGARKRARMDLFAAAPTVPPPRRDYPHPSHTSPDNDPDDIIGVFDLETTGFRGMPLIGKEHAVLQLAGKVLGAEDRDTFMSYVRVSYVDPQSERIHGVSAETTRDAPTFQQAFAAMLRHMGHDPERSRLTLVAHNAYGFDKILVMRDIPAELLRGVRFFDTLPWFRRHVRAPRYALGELLSFLHPEVAREYANLHQADVDVNVLSRLVLYNVPRGDCLKTRPNDAPHLQPGRTCASNWDIGRRGAAMLRKRGVETYADLAGALTPLLPDRLACDRWLACNAGVSDHPKRILIMSGVFGTPEWRAAEDYGLPDANGCLNEVEARVRGERLRAEAEATAGGL